LRCADAIGRQRRNSELCHAHARAQAGRPFEHEATLKALLARQAELNAALDLDKSDAQATEPAAETEIETPIPYRDESAMRRLQPNSTLSVRNV
jgi:hypothetical protein